VFEGKGALVRVFVDTNVLFPFSGMDLMLALTEDSVHEIVWSQRLLSEWERVIVRERQRSAESASAVTRAIRRYFADCEIEESAYAHLVGDMPGDDPDDRHHSAAAVAAGAGVLITWNLSDFPAEALAARGVRVVDPDCTCSIPSRRGPVPHGA
jgi:predicted nucleic acid-binding protein